jgi:hypothetical protein
VLDFFYQGAADAASLKRRINAKILNKKRASFAEQSVFLCVPDFTYRISDDSLAVNAIILGSTGVRGNAGITKSA